MNYRFDLIIIGDSKEGNQLLKKLASTKINLNIAFISKEFKIKTTHDFLNVEYINDEVVYTDYKNRLFGCYLKNGDRCYASHLIIATGQKHEIFKFKNKEIPNVYYSTSNIAKSAKDQPALVIGNNEQDFKLALNVAKKYKQVYICMETIVPNCKNKTILDKINNTKNIVVLPNTKIKNIKILEGELSSIELDNYATVICQAIFINTVVKPDVSFVSNNLIKFLESDYLEVDTKHESTLVPKCYALGKCVLKNTKKMQENLITAILNDFNN